MNTFSPQRTGSPLAIALITVVLLLFGCTVSVKEKPAVEAAITVVAAEDINPDITDRPSPILLRVYELGAAGSFQNAEFFPLYEKDDAVLGRDLINREAFLIKPGETHPLGLPLNSDTHFIGVVAAFSNIEQAQWRAVVQVDQEKAINLTIKIEKLAVSIE